MSQQRSNGMRMRLYLFRRMIQRGESVRVLASQGAYRTYPCFVKVQPIANGISRKNMQVPWRECYAGGYLGFFSMFWYTHVLIACAHLCWSGVRACVTSYQWSYVKVIRDLGDIDHTGQQGLLSGVQTMMVNIARRHICSRDHVTSNLILHSCHCTANVLNFSLEQFICHVSTCNRSTSYIPEMVPLARLSMMHGLLGDIRH